MARSGRGIGQVKPPVGQRYCKASQGAWSTSFYNVFPVSGRGKALFAPRIGDLLVSTFAVGPQSPPKQAGVAQLVEQLICNHQVVGSSPITGSSIFNKLRAFI